MDHFISFLNHKLTLSNKKINFTEKYNQRYQHTVTKKEKQRNKNYVM